MAFVKTCSVFKIAGPSRKEHDSILRIQHDQIDSGITKRRLKHSAILSGQKKPRRVTLYEVMAEERVLQN